MATINQVQYEWGHITTVVMGRPVVGIQGIEYKKAQEKEHLFGRGNKAIGIQKGNQKCDGTLTILQAELEAMCSAAGARKSVTDLGAIDITVAYVPENSTKITVDILRGVEFTEMPKGMKQGDKNAEHALPFICLDIEYGV